MGSFTDFTWRVYGTVSIAQEYGLIQVFFIFIVSVAAKVDFMVSRIGPTAPLPLTPVNSTVATTGIK